MQCSHHQMNLEELLTDIDLKNKKFTFAGKTGSSQIKRFTEEHKERQK